MMGTSAQILGAVEVADKNRRGAVRSADDGNAGGILNAEHARKNQVHQAGQRQRHKNAELRGRAKQQQLGIGQQRAEVDHRADADEQQQREQLAQGAHLDAQLMHLVDGAGKRQVDKDGAEAHGQQQAGLHVLLDSQVDQSAADGPHHDHFNGRNGIKRQDASKHRIDKIHEYFHLRFLSPFQRFGISPI